jgi:4-carboxymuconolactone decarboxylase
MTETETGLANMAALDVATVGLVRLAAVITVGDEPDVREALEGAAAVTPHEWIEELILQSYLFAGFPRTLNAARDWRRISGRPAPESDQETDIGDLDSWQARGEATCSTVYGPFYDGLRRNIRTLHPALDSWMIVDGYGKVLGRPGLDLKRRELCIVACCAVARQSRQLHSHLHGALHAGATVAEVNGALDAIEDMLDADGMRGVRFLWARVRGK